MKKNTALWALLLLPTLLLFSCKKNNGGGPATTDDQLPANETWVIFSGNADWSGGIYALKDKRARSLNLSGLPFFQLDYSAGGKLVGNVLYKLNGTLSTDIGISKYTINATNQVKQDGFVATPGNTYETNYLVVSNSEGYYWDLTAGGLKIQEFNPSTMQRTGEIDFSSLSKGSTYEAAGQLILAKRANKLYVDLQFGTRNTAWQVAPDEDTAYIAVYNLDTRSIEKVTSYPGATHLGLFADHVLWSIDEVTQDLYVVAIGDMRAQTPHSKILRIKKGSNEFDRDFELKISDYQYPSDFNRLFAYNNKIYTTISSRPTSYYGGGQHGVSYRQDIWYWTEIDTETKRANRLNIPPDNFYSYQNPFYHEGNIYFLSNNKADGYAGVNQYNPNTGAIKETFRLQESGRLMGFNIIKE